MNPYFQNQQFGFPNQGTYYGYNQNAYQNYTYTNPTQTIQAMYTTVHPYNNKQFLFSTFGNKPQYISIFLTLLHQDKLKMYMLMQQKKLYGQFSDKEAYQKILKQIAQKIQNFNLFHQSDTNKKATQTKSKELESKIDLIVEQTFQKLNLVQNQPKSNDFKKKQQEADEQEQWVQSTETIELQKQNNSNSPKPKTQSKSKEIQVNNPIFNMFTFDNTMQEAMTHQIGLKTVNQLQKKSIWDLQVDQSQIKQSEPNFKQIFKVKTSSQLKPKQAISQNQLPEHNVKSQSLIKSIQIRQQQTMFPMNAASIYDLYKLNSSPPMQIPTNKSKQKQEEQQFEDYMTTIHHQPNTIQNSIDFHNIIFENTSPLQNNSNQVVSLQIPNQKQNINIQTQQIQYENKVQSEQDQDFQFAQQNHQNIPQNHSLQNPQIVSLQIPQTQVKTVQQTNLNTLDYQSILFDSVQVQAPSVQVQFNFLQVLTSPREKVSANYQPPQNSLSYRTQEIEIGQTLFQSQVFSQSGMPQQLQLPQHFSQKKLQTTPLDLIRSSLATNNWQHQQMLKKLKIQMSEEDKSTALKGLKNKSFECNLQFYSLIINYLRQISLQWSPEYRHMTQHYKIVKELHEQSQRYTAAVDQDQQQKVSLSIRKTKQLLNTIQQNSPKTQKYVINLLDDKSEQKGLLYKFGRNLLSSSLSTEIFQKVTNQDNKQILKSFTVLYIIQKLSSIPKLKFFSQKLMIFLGMQYQKYKNLQEQSLRQVQNQEQSYPKFILFVKGIVKICEICQRMITLLKLCCLKTNSNTVKLLKICKDIKVRYSQYDNSRNSDDLLDLQEAIRINIQRNKSVYDLHTDFFKNYKEKPVCGICLKQVKNDGNMKEEIYYHYSCFNLSLRLQKQIEYFTQ